MLGLQHLNAIVQKLAKRICYLTLKKEIILPMQIYVYEWLMRLERFKQCNCLLFRLSNFETFSFSCNEIIKQNCAHVENEHLVCGNVDSNKI